MSQPDGKHIRGLSKTSQSAYLRCGWSNAWGRRWKGPTQATSWAARMRRRRRCQRPLPLRKRWTRRGTKPCTRRWLLCKRSVTNCFLRRLIVQLTSRMSASGARRASSVLRLEAPELCAPSWDPRQCVQPFGNPGSGQRACESIHSPSRISLKLSNLWDLI